MIACKAQFNIQGTDQTMTSPAEKPLSAAAKRALAEAKERRKLAEKDESAREIDGRDGPEPTRYGDWEKKGIASDF